MTATLYALFLLAALVCMAYGAGRVVSRGMRGLWAGRLERFVFAVPLGLGVAGLMLLPVGLLGFYRVPVFIAVLLPGVGGAALLVRDLLRGKGDTPAAPRPPVALLCAAALAAIGGCALIAALAPPSGLEWDALSYHLAGPKTYGREGRIFYIPYDHHTNFPFLLQLIYGLMLGLGSMGGAKACHWLCGVLLTASVYTFARRHFGLARGHRLGLFAAVVVASTPIVIWEATVAYVDLATTLFTWLALYALLNASTVSGVAPDPDGETPVGTVGMETSVRWLVLSAVLMGFALGTKFTVLAFWGMLLVGVGGWHFALTRRWAKETIPHAAIWAGVSLVIGAPWYIKTWLYTGNPVYPFLYSVFGGRYWNAENAAQYTRDQATLGLAKTPVNLLLDPWQATMLPDAATFTEYYTFALSPVFAAFALAALLRGRRLSRTALHLLLFSAGVYAFWWVSVEQTRYLIPAIPALALVCAEVFDGLWQERGGVAKWGAGAVVALSAGWGVYVAGGLAFWGVRDFGGRQVAGAAWPVVSGQMSLADYIDTRLPGYGEAQRWINTNTPPDSKVALFDEVRGFYLDRPYIWAQPDHAAGLLPWDSYRDTDDWLADFKRRGYTTLLVGARDPNAAPDNKRWRTLLADAIQSGKITLAYTSQRPGLTTTVKQPDGTAARVAVPVQVYRLP